MQISYKDTDFIKYQIDVLGKTRKELAEELGVSVCVIGSHYDPSIMERNRVRTTNLMKHQKLEAINILGGACEMCGTTDIRVLSLHHKNGDGSIDRKNKISTRAIYRKIIKNDIDISKFQCLCLNCNCGTERRHYMTIPPHELTKLRRYRLNLWIKAFSFFGSCAICGDSDLRHLTIGHIYNDGNIRRRCGEPSGSEILKKFNVMGWPEELHEVYQMECFNCNMSKSWN